MGANVNCLHFVREWMKHLKLKDLTTNKEAVKKFRLHKNSDSHLEACTYLNTSSIREQLSSQAVKTNQLSIN